MEKCQKVKCLKEINPEVYPGVYFGKAFEFDKNCGECVECRIMKEEK